MATLEELFKDIDVTQEDLDTYLPVEDKPEEVFNQPTRELAEEIDMELPDERQKESLEDIFAGIEMSDQELDESLGLESAAEEIGSEEVTTTLEQSEDFISDTEIRADTRTGLDTLIDNITEGAFAAMRGEDIPEGMAPGIGVGEVIGTTASIIESTPTVAAKAAEGFTVAIGTLPTDLLYLATLTIKNVAKGREVLLPTLNSWLEEGNPFVTLEEFNTLSEEFDKSQLASILDTTGDVIQEIGDNMGANIKEAFEPLVPEDVTEAEAEVASIVTLIAGGALGAKKKVVSYMKHKKATSTEGITSAELFDQSVKGEVLGVGVVNSKELDNESLVVGLTGGDIDPTLESRFIVPLETGGIAQSLKGVFVFGQESIKGLKKIHSMSKDAIDKWIPLDNELAAEDVWLKSELRLIQAAELEVEATEKLSKIFPDTIRNEGGQQLVNPKDEILETSLRQNVDPEILTKMYPNYKALAVTGEDMKSIFESKTADAHAAFVSRYSPLYNIERVSRAASEYNKTGRRDILENSIPRKVQLIDEQSGVQAKSLVGDYVSLKDPKTHRLSIRRKEDGLLEAVDGKPLNVVFNEAIQSSGSEEAVSNYLIARDTLDTIIYKNQQREGLEQQIKDIAADLPVGVDPSKKGFIEDLKANKEFDEEITNKVISKISNLRSQIDKYYTVDPEVQKIAEATVTKYEKEPWVKPLLEGKNKISNIVLDEAVLSGRLSQKDANNIRAAHPNYTPHYRVIEVEGVDSLNLDKDISSSGVLKYRSGNDKLKNIGALDAHVLAITKTLNATEMQRRKKGIFDFLIQLDDEAWGTLFREPKEDVVIALEKIKQGNVRRITNTEVTPLQITDTMKKTADPESFFIDGVELQLTPNNKLLRNILDYKAKDSGLVMKAMHNMATLNRNAITVYNPFFQVRSFLRETEGTMIFSNAVPYKDYIPFKSNLETVFNSTIDPKMDEFFRLNYGLGKTYGSDLSGLPLEEQIKRIRSNIQDKGILSTQPLKNIHSFFENTAEKVELAPRIMEYKIAKAHGKTDAEALALAKDLSINFSQKGYSTRWDNAIRSAPFLAAHIKGLDRMFRLGKYEPKQMVNRMMYGVYPKYLAIKEWNSLFGDESFEELYGDEKPFNRKMTDDEIILGIPPKFKEILLGDDPENLKDFAQAVRDNGGYYNTLRMPRAHGIGVVGSIGVDSMIDFIGSSMDLIYDKVIEDKYNNTDIGKELAAQGFTLEKFFRSIKDILAGGTLPGSVTPPIFNIPMDLAANKNYFSNPIVPRSVKQPEGRRWTEDKPGTLDAFKAYAKDLAKPDRNGIATGIDVSPIQLQYIMQVTLADAGLSVMQLGERMVAKVRNDGAEVAEIPNNKIFSFRQVFGSVGKRNNLPLIDKFYTANNYLSDKKVQLDSLTAKADGPNATAQDSANLQNFYNEYRDELAMYDLFDQAKQDINVLRVQIKNIREDKSIGTVETEFWGDPVKAKMIQGLEQEMLNIYSSALATSRFWDDEYREALARKPFFDSKGLEFVDPFEMYKGFKLRQRSQYLDQIEEEEDRKQLQAILNARQ